MPAMSPLAGIGCGKVLFRHVLDSIRFHIHFPRVGKSRHSKSGKDLPLSA